MNCFTPSHFFTCLILLASLLAVCAWRDGAMDPVYRSCVEGCGRTGCIDAMCFPNCKALVNGANIEGSSGSFLYDSLYLRWREVDCNTECQYQCMMHREAQRESEGQQPVKYHGKWPLKRVLGLQEPASVAFSVANLALHFQGWLSFLVLVYYKLPQRPQGNKTPYYEYTDLWIMYGFLSMNFWFWSAAFHSRDMDIIGKLDYSSAVALLGYTLILAIIRTCNLRIEAARVMVAAPIIAFVSTHIMYLNFYTFDGGLNKKVCVMMGVIQLLLWTFWAGVTRHPARFKIWFVVLTGAMVMFLMLLEIFDFPPIWGWLDVHSLWHAITVPLTYVWWSFIKDDASLRTSQLISRSKEVGDSKKVQ